MSLHILVLYVLLFVTGFWVLIFFYKNLRLDSELKELSDKYFLLAENKGYFSKKKNFIRNDELVFFRTISDLYRDKYYIFPQVHLSELIDVTSGYRDHENLYRLLGNKSIDFLLADKEVLKPIAAIELNGGIHLTDKQKQRDELKKSVFKIANIPLISIQKQVSYNSQELRDIIDQSLVTQK